MKRERRAGGKKKGRGPKIHATNRPLGRRKEEVAEKRREKRRKKGEGSTRANTIETTPSNQPIVRAK